MTEKKSPDLLDVSPDDREDNWFGQFDRILDKMRDWPLIGNILDPRPRVAVVRLSGVISDGGPRRGSISYPRYRTVIEKAFEGRNVQAVVLAINCPGGAPSQTALLSRLIRQMAVEKKLPVLAFVEDVAASGGYWLACAADEIFAQETSIVGSIGVISSGFGLDEFIERHGISRRLHTAGKDKSFLDPFLPEKSSDVAHLKAVQKEMHAVFRDWVRERRGGRLNGDEADLFEGRFWTGATALDLGLIDGLSDMRTILRDRFGERVRLIDVEPERRFPGLPFGVRASSDDGEFWQLALTALDHWAVWKRFGL